MESRQVDADKENIAVLSTDTSVTESGKATKQQMLEVTDKQQVRTLCL